jgi:hypothetical protein
VAPWMMGPRSLTQYQLPKINAVNKGGLSCEVRGGADVDPHNTFSAGDEIAGRLAIYPKESISDLFPARPSRGCCPPRRAALK